MVATATATAIREPRHAKNITAFRGMVRTHMQPKKTYDEAYKRTGMLVTPTHADIQHKVQLNPHISIFLN